MGLHSIRTLPLVDINRIPTDGPIFPSVQVIEPLHIILIKREIIEIGIGVDA